MTQLEPDVKARMELYFAFMLLAAHNDRQLVAMLKRMECLEKEISPQAHEQLEALYQDYEWLDGTQDKFVLASMRELEAELRPVVPDFDRYLRQREFVFN